MRTFVVLLSYYVERSGKSVSELAKRIGVSRATVYNALSGKHTPKHWDDEAWADGLGLTGDEREEFLDAVHIADAPPRIPKLLSVDPKRAKRSGP